MPFQKGQIGNPKGRPVGAKNKTTLLKEERRAIFEDIVSQDWEERIKRLPDVYVADQFLGKAPEKLEHSGEIKSGESLSPEVIATAKELLKKKLQDGK